MKIRRRVSVLFNGIGMVVVSMKESPVFILFLISWICCICDVKVCYLYYHVFILWSDDTYIRLSLAGWIVKGYITPIETCYRRSRPAPTVLSCICPLRLVVFFQRLLVCCLYERRVALCNRDVVSITRRTPLTLSYNPSLVVTFSLSSSIIESIFARSRMFNSSVNRVLLLVSAASPSLLLGVGPSQSVLLWVLLLHQQDPPQGCCSTVSYRIKATASAG